MLNPNTRSLYLSALTPPPGMIFDEAIATTFSMDPTVLLEAPVHLALMAADMQKKPDLISTLAAIRKNSEKISVYVQKGRIQVPQNTKPNPLFALLEEMVIEVKAPRGGVFHPKIWAIRFTDPVEKTAMLRLVVLSRNMTTDQSWDLSLQLEGNIGKHKEKSNRPLARFFKSLPGLAGRAIERERIQQANRFSEDIYRSQWDLPEGFDELVFYLPGSKEFKWDPPPKVACLAIISPFCSDAAIQSIVATTQPAEAFLVSRPESLSKLKTETLALFSKCLHLDEAAESGDGEDEISSSQEKATGLHAKAYLYETRHYSDYTHIVMGSANATDAALEAPKNIEILVELTGKKSKVGSIAEILGPDGLGEYLVPFDSGESEITDEKKRQAEKNIEKARTLLVDASLSVTCEKTSGEDLWALSLVGRMPPLAGVVIATAWPITVDQDWAVDILEDKSGLILIGNFSPSSLTGLIAFELQTDCPDISARFVLNLPINGVPEERKAAILNRVIANQEGFIRYLLLLLGDGSSDELPEYRGSSGWGRWLSHLADQEDIPLLEELTRTYSRYPDRLLEISTLIHELSSHENKVIPEDFLKVWSVFETAIGEHHAR